MLGRRRIRDLGPVGWLYLAGACFVILVALAVAAGWRAPVEASRPSRLILPAIGAVLLVWVMQRMVRGARHPETQSRAAQDANLLLVVLSVACGMLSLLLGPR
jgi:4-hydroxybenzoate polyprenyltransferase